MKKRYLILLALLALTLTCILSGCGKGEQDLDGMYVVSFDVNGGKLDLGTSAVTTKVNYAYEPGSLVMDPTVRIGESGSSYLGYSISRPDYDFTGWYTGPECLPEQKWDFATGVVNSEKLTLYAGWQKQIIHTFTVCYQNGSETVLLGSYRVKAGDAFDDYRNFAKARKGYTANGYYADAALTTPWSSETVHPGGDVDTDVKVYVDYVAGDWVLVETFAELKKAIGKGNIYLTANIDCEGKELTFGDFGHVLEGNGFAISNFKVNKYGTSVSPTATIFKSLRAGAEIRNVSFTGVTFTFTNISQSARYVQVAALSAEATDCVVTNVTVTGTFVTDYEKDLPRLNQAFYGDTATGTVTGFSAEIVVEKQP